MILPRQRVKCQIKRVNVPHLSGIDPDRSGHPTVDHQLVEFPRRHSDVHGRLVTGEATARDRTDIGKSAHHHPSASASAVAIGPEMEWRMAAAVTPCCKSRLASTAASWA